MGLFSLFNNAYSQRRSSLILRLSENGPFSYKIKTFSIFAATDNKTSVTGISCGRIDFSRLIL